MKKFVLASVLLTAAVTVSAQHRGYAEVVRVEPRLVTVNQQQCREVAVQRPATNGNAAGGVLGAIAGAALGNQIGGGSGRDIATVVGGVVGYQVGKGEAQPGGVEYRTECSMVPVTVQRGETVTFRYNGRIFTQTFE